MLLYRYLTITLLFILLPFALFAQSFNKAINKDSLLSAVVTDLPDTIRNNVLEVYHAGTESDREFLLMLLAMPRSSKTELIKNIDTNYASVSNLRTEYAKLVPKGLIVSIEFNPKNYIAAMDESIDMEIVDSSRTDSNRIMQEWQMGYHSYKLKKFLDRLKWDNNTLVKIKGLLDAAHCVSIENGAVTTIGYQRSGMGKYFYDLFDHDLTSSEEIKKYNDACMYIFYKKNIVLEYGSGATGSMCFPD